MAKAKFKKAYKSAPSKPSIVTAILFVLLIVYILGLFVPVIWALISSFWQYGDYKIFYLYKAFDKVKLPSKKTFENFSLAWKNLTITTIETAKHPETTYNILGLFENSILYTVGCALAFTICPCFVAYATARFKFKFSKIVYAFVIVVMALPIVGSTPSELRMLEALNLNGSFFGMWILRSHFLTIYYLIFYAQFETIPMDYTEAARVDGANNFWIMVRVILPQALNTIVTVFVLAFISYWNEYQVPLIYLPEYPTVGYCIYYFTSVSSDGNITSYIPVQMAGTVIMTLPIIVFFIIFNKRLRVGVNMGGIKG